MRSHLPKSSYDERRLLKNELLDLRTFERIELAAQNHPIKADRPRARKRYTAATAQGRIGIEEAIRERKLRRLRALWNPD